jgi:hypothetical protein
LIGLIVLSAIALFLRMIFVSLEDIAKIAKIESMAGGSDYWKNTLLVQLIAEVFCTLSVFASVYLIYRLENALAMSAQYSRLQKKH